MPTRQARVSTADSAATSRGMLHPQHTQFFCIWGCCRHNLVVARGNTGPSEGPFEFNIEWNFLILTQNKHEPVRMLSSIVSGYSAARTLEVPCGPHIMYDIVKID